MLTGILWAAVSRNDIVLAEAGEDNYDGAVIKLAQKILNKKATAVSNNLKIYCTHSSQE